MFRAPQLPRTLEAALRDVSEKKPQVRVDAIRDLARHCANAEAGSEIAGRITRALEAALRDPVGEVRSAAAIALADVGADGALPSLLVAVEDDDAQVRQMAITALGEIGDPRATERLRRALSDRRPEVRFQAAIAFPRVCASRADAIEALVRATEDKDPLVCHIALRMAEEVGGADAPEDHGAARPARPEGKAVVDARVLARARELCDHPAPIVRVAAAIIAARAGETAGRSVIEQVARGELSTDDGEDVAAAIELSGELGLEAVQPALERRAFGGALGLRRDRFAWHARVALARMGHERATRDILAELRSWNRDRRTLAVAAAGRARIAGARETIAAMRGDPDRADPDAVEDALAAIGSLG